MKRQSVVACATASLFAPPRLLAQPRQRPARIGWPASVPITRWPLYAVLTEAMRERGWIEGTHHVVDAASYDGDPERMPAVTAELIARRVRARPQAFNRVHDGWRIATHVASSLLAIAFLLGLVLTPRLAGAQARAGVPRIGILELRASPSATNPELPTAAGFRQGLRELGYVEGQNILVERRYAEGQPERAAALAAELVQLKVDVILTTSPATREAASKATRSIPIVTVSGSDPEREGWARSLARPGGNVTGLTVTYPGLSAKRFEILKSAFPSLDRVAVLIDPTELPNPKQVVLDMEAGARQLGLQLQVLEVRGPADFDAAFILARQRHAQALYVIATNLMAVHRVRLAGLAASDRLPSISDFRMMAEAGLVMSYGVDLHDLGRRAITHVHKILEGAQPGDLAVERPTRFQLIVNLKTAKALGIAIPQTLLLRADEVIQ